MTVPNENLGGARLSVGETGTVLVETGDELLGDTPIHVIKIDAEGMELDVLEGLAGVIARNRPAMFIEVEERHAEAFEEYLRRIDYRIDDRFRRYPEIENYMVVSD
jgi:hypothetical protein